MPRKDDRLRAAQVIYQEAQEAKIAGDLPAMAAKLNQLGDVLAKEAPKDLRDVPEISDSEPILWDKAHTIAAFALADGKTQEQVAEEVGVTSRSIRNWLQNQHFSAEVDRLSLMIGIATRAERLRLARRVIRQKASGSTIQTDKDILDWLKFAQSETDGIKLDIGKLAAALGADDPSLAAGRQAGTSGEPESDAVN